MAPRTDIFETSRNGNVKQIAKYRYPLNILVQARLLTKSAGEGRPEISPVPIRSMLDVARQEPFQQIELTDEHQNRATYDIDFAKDVACGQDLIDNTSPERLTQLMSPSAPSVPFELGLCDRLNHYIATAQCLLQRLSRKLPIPQHLREDCDAAEQILLNSLEMVEQAEGNSSN